MTEATIPSHRAASVEFDHVTKSYDAAAAKRGAPGVVNDLDARRSRRPDLRPRGPVGLWQDHVAQDGQPAHRADVRADPARRRGRGDAGHDRAPPRHRVRHPADGPVPAPDDRGQRRHGAPPPRLGQGADAGARGGAAVRGRPRPRDVRPALPRPAERRRATAGRGRARARGGPAGHAHGRAVRRRGPDRPGAAPERVPAPPGAARQDDPVRDPRHRRGDQDGRPRGRVRGGRRRRAGWRAGGHPRRARRRTTSPGSSARTVP